MVLSQEFNKLRSSLLFLSTLFICPSAGEIAEKFDWSKALGILPGTNPAGGLQAKYLAYNVNHEQVALQITENSE